jgi:hypothetical protein
MKRSNAVTLALMGTASFAASFAAGSAVLGWTRPAAAPKTVTAASQPVAGAVLSTRQNCTTRPDGLHSCPSSAATGGGSWGPAWLYPNVMRAGAQALGPSRTGAPSGTARGGFGATSRGMAHASAGG